MRHFALAAGAAVLLASAALLGHCTNVETTKLTCPLSLRVGERVELGATSNDRAVAHGYACESGSADFALVTADGAQVPKGADGFARATAPTTTGSSASGEVRISKMGFLARGVGTVACRAVDTASDSIARAGTCTITIDPGGPCDPITDFAGRWRSDWKCTSSTGVDEMGTQEVQIQQTGNQASYTTSKTYAGTVCLNRWTFSATKVLDAGADADGGVETEQGSLTMVDAGYAVRASTWSAPGAMGTCDDTFSRLP